jgi:hypothetical protein
MIILWLKNGSFGVNQAIHLGYTTSLIPLIYLLYHTILRWRDKLPLLIQTVNQLFCRYQVVEWLMFNTAWTNKTFLVSISTIVIWRSWQNLSGKYIHHCHRWIYLPDKFCHLLHMTMVDILTRQVLSASSYDNGGYTYQASFVSFLIDKTCLVSISTIVILRSWQNLPGKYIHHCHMKKVTKLVW